MMSNALLHCNLYVFTNMRLTDQVAPNEFEEDMKNLFGLNDVRFEAEVEDQNGNPHLFFRSDDEPLKMGLLSLLSLGDTFLPWAAVPAPIAQEFKVETLEKFKIPEREDWDEILANAA